MAEPGADPMSELETCPTCRGNGRVDVLEHCPTCAGSGWAAAALWRRYRELEARLPAAEAEIQRLTVEHDASMEAMNEKLKALAPHGSCSCSIDGPGQWCIHHSPMLAKAEAENAMLRAVAERYERWEADLLLSNEAWADCAGLPTLTQSLFDELMEIQALRNAALARLQERTDGR